MYKIKVLLGIILAGIIMSCDNPAESGEGVKPSASPEINITYENNSLLSGEGSYSFGNTVADGEDGAFSSILILNIENLGTSNLMISQVFLESGNTSDFDLEQPQELIISPQESISFDLRFDPLTVGDKTAILTILSNDSDESNYSFSVTGTGSDIPEPEVNVKQGDTTLIDELGSYSFGSCIADGDGDIVSDEIFFSVENLGAADLHINGLSLNSGDISDFEISTGTLSSITPEESHSFSVLFDPQSIGDKQVEVQILCNDSDEAIYTFFITGAGQPIPVPEIQVLNGVQALESGNGTYDFGIVLADGDGEVVSGELVLTIQNRGTADLSLSHIGFSSGDTEDFDLVDTSLFTILPSEEQTLSISFDPISSGDKEVELIISNSDSDESSYSITLLGNGLEPTPEITIKQGESELASGTSSYSFSDIPADGLGGLYSEEATFKITNNGTAVLDIQNIEIISGNTDDFVIASPASASLGVSEDISFIVGFDPLKIGEKSVTIHILSNDSDEATYSFELWGNAIPFEPEIQVKQSSLDLPSGSGIYDFGEVGIAYSSSVISFSIENLGLDTLVLTGSPSIIVSGTDASMFVVSEYNDMSSLGNGDQTSFSLQFKPTETGEKTATVIISSNDADEGSFSFEVRGFSVGPNLEIKSYYFDDGKFIISDSTHIGDHDYEPINIVNVGYETLHITSLFFSGQDADMFSVAEETITIVPGETYTLWLTFTPTLFGGREAALNLISNDTFDSTYSFQVVGTALPLHYYVGGTSDLGTYSTLHLDSTDTPYISFRNADESCYGRAIYENGTLSDSSFYAYGGSDDELYYSWADILNDKLVVSESRKVIKTGQSITWNSLKVYDSEY